MGCVDDDQLLHGLLVKRRQLVGDDAAPVVAQQDAALPAEHPQQLEDVLGDLVCVVVVLTGGLR